MKRSLAIFCLITTISCNQPAKQTTAKLWTEAERRYLIENLERTRNDLLAETEKLNEGQYNFKESPERWSILQIVEHLEIQDNMFLREMDVIPSGPEQPQYIEKVKGNDQMLLDYANDPTKATAGYLEPIGRFCTLEAGRTGFVRVRNMNLDIVKTTDKDLRKYFTFRSYPNDGHLTDPSIYDVRDLHQLMLTAIAHTDRHLNQLRKVKSHKDFPKSN